MLTKQHSRHLLSFIQSLWELHNNTTLVCCPQLSGLIRTTSTRAGLSMYQWQGFSFQMPSKNKDKYLFCSFYCLLCFLSCVSLVIIVPAKDKFVSAWNPCVFRVHFSSFLTFVVNILFGDSILQPRSLDLLIQGKQPNKVTSFSDWQSACSAVWQEAATFCPCPELYSKSHECHSWRISAVQLWGIGFWAGKRTACTSWPSTHWCLMFLFRKVQSPSCASSLTTAKHRSLD